MEQRAEFKADLFVVSPDRRDLFVVSPVRRDLFVVSPVRRDLFVVSPVRRDLFVVSPVRRDLSCLRSQALHFSKPLNNVGRLHVTGHANQGFMHRCDTDKAQDIAL
jgi:hypothetical protein